MPPVYPRPYGRGIARAAPGLFFWKRSAPPRTLIVVAIHPRAHARGILAHPSKLYRQVCGRFTLARLDARKGGCFGDAAGEMINRRKFLGIQDERFSLVRRVEPRAPHIRIVEFPFLDAHAYTAEILPRIVKAGRIGRAKTVQVLGAVLLERIGDTRFVRGIKFVPFRDVKRADTRVEADFSQRSFDGVDDLRLSFRGAHSRL